MLSDEQFIFGNLGQPGEWMARWLENDITISLISCQIETSTVLVLERLFVSIIEAEQNNCKKGNTPSFLKL